MPFGFVSPTCLGVGMASAGCGVANTMRAVFLLDPRCVVVWGWFRRLLRRGCSPSRHCYICYDVRDESAAVRHRSGGSPAKWLMAPSEAPRADGESSCMRIVRSWSHSSATCSRAAAKPSLSPGPARRGGAAAVASRHLARCEGPQSAGADCSMRACES